MLKLEDRIRVALGAEMGIRVEPSEVETIARMLVVLRKIARGEIKIGQVRQAAAEAIATFKE